jgi:putative heme-binding domain-containing protein
MTIAAPGQGGPTDARFEALRRLKGLDLEANPTLRTALFRILEQSRGTPQFLEIVRDFNLRDQIAGLLEVAQNPAHPNAGAEAMRMVLQAARTNDVALALQQASKPQCQALIRALADCGDVRAIPMLVTALTNRSAPQFILDTALQGLTRTERGCIQLLDMARQGSLTATMKNNAALALARAPWSSVRQQASTALPAAPSHHERQSPPTIDSLLTESGDPERGAQIFRSEAAACIKCHRLGTEGVDFGPALTQIGSKLGKEALYEAILNPSAGIAFGYEAWSMETTAGDEITGIIISETPQELTLKQQTGVTTRLEPSRILHRQRLKLSVMPAGLGGLIAKEDLIDLVEFLTTLRAP